METRNSLAVLHSMNLVHETKPQQESVKGGIGELLAALKACTRSRDVKTGREVHLSAVQSGQAEDVYVASCLINMYAKCGCLTDARLVLESSRECNVVCWNALILGYAENGEGQVAVELYSRMVAQGLTPTCITFLAVLRACNSVQTDEVLAKVRALHCQASRHGCDKNITVCNALIYTYAKSGTTSEARKVFDSIEDRNKVSWNSMLFSYADNGQELDALELFSEMQRESLEPDAVTFIAAAKSCAVSDGERLPEAGRKNNVALPRLQAVHAQASEVTDILLCNTFIDMYAKFGRLDYAKRVFDTMLERSVVSWNALIYGYAENGESQTALDLLCLMQLEGCAFDDVTLVAALKACTALAAKDGLLHKGRAIHCQIPRLGNHATIAVYNTLIDMYAKCGSMGDAKRLFDLMVHRTVVTWTVLISGYADTGDGEQALELFAEMQRQNCTPDKKSLVAALRACSMVPALQTGRVIHSQASKLGLEKHPFVAAALVELYSKCGDMVAAKEVFDSVKSKDLVTWTTLLTGYSRCGQTDKVFELFDKMKDVGLEPNSVTFLSVLTACCHAGLVEKGRGYLESMESKYGVQPDVEHYTCVIDMLGRANELEAAVAMIEKMPFEADAVTWKTILGACQRLKNAPVGRRASDRLIELDRNDAAAYVFMANIYGSPELEVLSRS